MLIHISIDIELSDESCLTTDDEIRPEICDKLDELVSKLEDVARQSAIVDDIDNTEWEEV